MTISPNPAGESLTFQLSIGGLPPPPLSSPTLVLYWITGERAGEEAVDLSLRLMPLFRTRTVETVMIPRRELGGLPRGMYLCRFTYASYAVTRLLMLL
jgi:hypothetical protein